MNVDPLYPHLMEILADPASKHMILAGGYGIRLKREHLAAIGSATLIPDLPEARATVDLDFFLRMEAFVAAEQGASVRTMLDRLGYVVTEGHAIMQFARPLGASFPADRRVLVDLLARWPEADEERARTRVDNIRVKSRRSIGLHGRATPEAFAVEDTPIRIALRDEKENSEVCPCSTSICVDSDENSSSDRLASSKASTKSKTEQREARL